MTNVNAKTLWTFAVGDEIRPITGSWWRPLNLTSLRGGLRYDADLIHKHSKEMKVVPSILGSFIRLADESDDSAFFDFAQQYGVLGLCRHGQPATHSLAWRGGIGDEELDSRGASTNKPQWHAGFCLPEGWPTRCIERFSTWRGFALGFRSALSLAEFLRTGTDLSSNFAASAAPLFSHFGLPDETDSAKLSPAQHKEIAKRSFASAVNYLLAHVILVPECTPAIDDRRAFSLRIVPREAIYRGHPALFTVLVLQLVAAVCRTAGLLLCCNCGTPYEAAKLPTRGEKSYCPKIACRRAAWRVNQRRRRGIL